MQESRGYSYPYVAISKRCLYFRTDWYVRTYITQVFTGNFCALLSPSFSRFRLQGTQEARLCPPPHVWVQAEVRGLCSRRPQSRELALFEGLRSPTPSRAGRWKPRIQYYIHWCYWLLFVSYLHNIGPPSSDCGSHGTKAIQQQPFFKLLLSLFPSSPRQLPSFLSRRRLPVDFLISRWLLPGMFLHYFLLY